MLGELGHFFLALWHVVGLLFLAVLLAEFGVEGWRRLSRFLRYRRATRPDRAAVADFQAFCRETGQPIPKTPAQLIRCAYESLALKYRQVLGWLEALTGQPIDVIHVVGGGSQSSILNQFTADACQRPVLAGPVEATAMGNLLVQVRADGELLTCEPAEVLPLAQRYFLF